MGELKLLSLTPVTKVFLDEPVREADARERFEGFQNETISFQLAFCGTLETARKCVYLEAASPLKEHLRIRAVQSVPVHLATLPDADDNYLRKTPGLYPDLLREQKPGDRMGSLRVQPGQWHAYFIDVEPNGACAPGEYPVELRLRDANEEAVYATATVTIRILPGMLPAQKLIRTHWFHCDCLANYYHVPVFSEEHWRLLENFIRLAVRRGCTMLLTPLFTPPLDTAKGGERTTVQLVDVRAENGAYSFGFERLERWVEMCERCGVTYYELSHLFSQWGAVAAPKIVATVDGEEKKLFGWHTDARGAEYAAFLKAFLTALMKGSYTACKSPTARISISRTSRCWSSWKIIATQSRSLRPISRAGRSSTRCPISRSIRPARWKSRSFRSTIWRRSSRRRFPACGRITASASTRM